jgi:hypothetical protein
MKTVSQDRAALRLPALRTPGKDLVAAYFALSLFAIFYIPYFFAVPPSTSESYIFGYNNKIGVILLLLLTSIGAIWTRGLDFNFSPADPSPRIPLKYLWIALVVEFSACVGMFLAVGRYGAFSEAEYEINGISLLSLGKLPNVDFEWAYGYGFLYIPKWLSVFLHISLADAYFLFWGFASLLGIVLLFATVNLISFPSRHRILIFLALSIFALLSVLNMGVHYSFIRFVCPLFFIVVVDKIHWQSQNPYAEIVAAASATLFTAVLMLISPEVTIAFAFACTIVLFPRRGASMHSSQIVTYLATLAALALLFAYGFRLHVFEILRTQTQGSNSFPIAFAPATVWFCCVVFICACYVVQRLSCEGIQDNTLALIAFSIPMTAGALGRCDPGHILMNGLGLFIAAFFYASATRLWTLYRTGFIACFLVIAPLTGILMSFHAFGRSALPAFPEDSDVFSLYPQTSSHALSSVFEAPFGYKPDAKGFYFSPQVDRGFYDSLLNATTPDAYQRKISELQQHPERSVLLRQGVLGACEVHEREERIIISILFAFPYTANAVHRESIRKPLCDYITAHYILAQPGTPSNFYYELWMPNP